MLQPRNSWFRRVLILLLHVALLAGCQSLGEPVPSKLWEGDNAWNYKRVFDEPIPADVSVVHSFVVTYAFRIGVITTDDWEFELIASDKWVEEYVEQRYLRELDDQASEFDVREVGSRRNQAKAWYAPGSLDQYDLYRDQSSAAYVHMLVRKTKEGDGRRRVFLSKH